MNRDISSEPSTGPSATYPHLFHMQQVFQACNKLHGCWHPTKRLKRFVNWMPEALQALGNLGSSLRGSYGHVHYLRK